MDLIIDTSTERAVVAVSKSGEPLAVRELPLGLQNSRYILPAVEELFLQIGRGPEAIELIAVGVGPGSYTGIRVGVAFAKTFAYVKKKPLLGFCSLKGFAPPLQGNFAALIDAKVGGVYMLLGSCEGKMVSFEGKPQVLPVEEARDKLMPIKQYIAPLTARLQERLGPLPGKWTEAAPSVAQLSRLIDCGRARAGAGDDLTLNYLRSWC